MEGFLSPEALRFLENLPLTANAPSQSLDELFPAETSWSLGCSRNHSNTNTQPRDSTLLEHTAASISPDHPQRKRKVESIHNIPGLSAFHAENTQESRRKRSKFDEKRREEIASIRKRGACIRCRYNKLPVAILDVPYHKCSCS